MKLTIVINDDFSNARDRLYESSFKLMNTIEALGHDLTVTHPQMIFNTEEGPKFSEVFRLDGGILSTTEEKPEDSEAVLVRSYGYTDSECDKLIEALETYERMGKAVVNPSHSIRYSNKKIMRTLDLPFIPEIRFESADEIKRHVAKGTPLIAKPSMGFFGKGVEYIATEDDIDKIGEGENYIFETFVPAEKETRVTFIDGQILFARNKHVEGEPAREKTVGHSYEPVSEHQRKIAEYVMKTTGMVVGSVDFRGDYVLELNGSGIGMIPDTSKEILSAIQKRV